MTKRKNCIVTGANSGIGFATARALAGQGFQVAMVCRSEAKGQAARQRILNEIDHDAVTLWIADLAEQDQIRRVAAELRAHFAQLDVLVNNAGTWRSELVYTPDEVESVFAINHLAYFLLTHELYPSLRQTPDGRVINVASDSHFQIKGLYLDDLFLTQRYHGLRSYAQSKLANVMFTYEFDRRRPDPQVSSYAVQPGLVQTDIGLKHTNWLHALVWRIRRRMRGNKSPAEGAATSIYLATEPAVADQSGQYWDDCRTKPSSEGSYDRTAAAQLWEESCRLCGIDTYF
jgi:NAD(P)-dependent dehydrogenase (short-subunit alcohol dehydrogenase family)